MTPEQRAWTSLRPQLQRLGLDPVRVENVLGAGTPDVWYSHGAIELKVVADWPKRPDTKVKIPHFTKEQKVWLSRRWEAGGLSWLWVRGWPMDLLFSGWDAQAVWKGLPTFELVSLAAHLGCFRPNSQALLTGDVEAMSNHHRALFHRLRCKKSREEVAEALGWSNSDVTHGESHPDSLYTDDLLSYWEA